MDKFDTKPIPSVIGLTIEEAESILKEVGFTFKLRLVNGYGQMDIWRSEKDCIDLEVVEATVTPSGKYSVIYSGGRVTRQYRG